MQVPGPFEYERATSVDQAVSLLDRLGDGALIVAGGHSLLPMMKLRIANPEYLVDINDLAGELGHLAAEPTLVRIGAMARHRQVLESDELAAQQRADRAGRPVHPLHKGSRSRQATGRRGDHRLGLGAGGTWGGRPGG